MTEFTSTGNELYSLPEFKVCPSCGSTPLTDDQQPQPSLHCYSTKFPCGFQVVNVYGDYENTEIEYGCGEERVDLIGELIKRRRETV